MRKSAECLVCKNPKAEIITDATEKDYDVVTTVIDCPDCGHFAVTNRVEGKLVHLSSAERDKVNQWIRREFESTGKQVVFNEATLMEALPSR